MVVSGVARNGGAVEAGHGFGEARRGVALSGESWHGSHGPVRTGGVGMARLVEIRCGSHGVMSQCAARLGGHGGACQEKRR